MKKEIGEALQRAADTGEPIDIGDLVVCDSCCEDFTDSEEVGGLLFAGWAICPRCVPAWEKSKPFIRARAAPFETFRAFVLRLRGGNNVIQIGPL